MRESADGSSLQHQAVGFWFRAGPDEAEKRRVAAQHNVLRQLRLRVARNPAWLAVSASALRRVVHGRGALLYGLRSATVR